MRATSGWVRGTAGIAAAIAMITLSACGSDDGTADIASAGGATPVAATTDPSGGTDHDEAALEFAECMRENGVDMPDPEPGQRGGFRAFGEPGEIDQEAMQAAFEACRDLAPMLGEQRELDPEQEEQMLALAECMREHGVDMPDPEPGGGGFVIGGDDVDRETIDAAREACGDLFEPPGGGSVGGGSASGGTADDEVGAE